MIYLDYAAATPTNKAVIKAIKPYLSNKFYNPSSLYTISRNIAQELYDCRAKVASLIGAKPTEIYFTAGATESINLAIAGVLRSHPNSKVVVGVTEHPAVLASAEGFAGQDNVIKTRVDGDGRINISALTKSITDEVVLVSIAYVNGEIGTIQPMKQIVEAVDNIKKERQQRGVDRPLYLHSDCSQAPEYLDIHVNRLGVDMMSLNGAKIYGLKQSGILYANRDLVLEPLIYGGGQEGGLRGGSESMVAAVGFKKAMEITIDNYKQESKRLKVLQQQLIKGLKEVDSQATINGSLKHRIPANVNVSFAAVNGETLVHHLDAAGICVATGSACVSGNGKPSHVLEAIGLDEQLISGSLRISMGRNTKSKDVSTLVDTLAVLVPKLRNK
ncbi:MAG: cysteine desulfurase family protein [Candidatus Saccharimonadales bacterium]